jgi:hypothetical protein
MIKRIRKLALALGISITDADTYNTINSGNSYRGLRLYNHAGCIGYNRWIAPGQRAYAFHAETGWQSPNSQWKVHYLSWYHGSPPPTYYRTNTDDWFKCRDIGLHYDKKGIKITIYKIQWA